MFTGIVQGIAELAAAQDDAGLRRFELKLPTALMNGLARGASVACDGVCLTVTDFDLASASVTFDVMQATLTTTTLAAWQPGRRVNIERSATAGAEIGGHVLSGHIDLTAQVREVRRPHNNHVLRIGVEPRWLRYLFNKGFVGVNGASLTVAEVNHTAGWFEVWLIPETLRATTFGQLTAADAVNLEIDRHTQVLVDTIERALQAQLAPLQRALTQLLPARSTPES